VRGLLLPCCHSPPRVKMLRNVAISHLCSQGMLSLEEGLVQAAGGKNYLVIND
jgi:hypothetical protein